MPLEESVTPVADESTAPAVDDPAATETTVFTAADRQPEPDVTEEAAGTEPDEAAAIDRRETEPDATDQVETEPDATEPDATDQVETEADATDQVETEADATDLDEAPEAGAAPTESDPALTEVVPERTGPGRRHIAVLATVAAFVLAADETTKSIVVAHVDPANSPRILGGLFYFSLIRNSGAAWGIAGGATILFALISAIVAGAIIRVAGRLRSIPWAIALGLLLGGALGNLSDRIFREPGFLRGRVVDFISVFGPDGRHFPIFNLADSAITTGAFLLAIATLLGVGIDGSRRSIEP